MNVLTSDIILEIIRSIVLLVITIYMWKVSENRRELLGNGWNLIFSGFFFLLFGSVIDITDNFDSLNRFVIVGDTPGQAFLEKMVGFLGGFLLIAIGLIKWIPAITSVEILQEKIEEQKVTERSLKESEEKWTSLVENAPNTILIVDAGGTILYINRTAPASTPEQTIGTSVYEHITPEFHDTMRQSLEQVFQNEECDRFELVIGTHGFTSWYGCHPVPIKHDGKVESVIIIAIDITERKISEETLKESEQKFRTIFDSINDALFITDMQGCIIETNEVACKRLGYTRNEMLQMTAMDLDSQEYAKGGAERIKRVLQEGEHLFETVHVRKDGSTIPAEVSARLTEYNGMPAILGVARDITERKRSEEKIQENELKFHSLVHSAQDAIVIIDNTSKIIFWNKAAGSIFFYEKEEVIGKSLAIIMPERYKNAHDKILGRSVSVGKTVELQGLRKDGTEIPIEISLASWKSRGKIYYSGIIRDITKRKEAEEALVEARIKAEDANLSKSEFLANMSHELRTPLNSVIGFSDMLFSQYFGPLNEKQLKYSNNISKSGKHLLELINEILDISKVEAGKMELHIEEFLIADTINEIRIILAPIALRKNISVVYEVATGLSSIKADKTKFKQILYNLVDNAIKFTHEGGSVSVHVRPVKDEIWISVIDEGIGISQEDQQKIFQPFKQVGKFASKEQPGTGLGLTLVKNFAEMHGGEVWLESEIGVGSTFTFTLPTKQN